MAMLRKVLIAIVFAFFIFLSFLFIKKSLQEKPFKWKYNYNEFSKQPYGSKLFFKQIHSFFPGSKVERVTDENFYASFFEPYSFDTLLLDSIRMVSPYHTVDSINYNNYDFNFIGINNTFYSNYYSTTSILSFVLDGGNCQIHSKNLDFSLSKIFSLKYAEFNKDEILPESDTALKVIDGSDTLSVRAPEMISYLLDYDSSGTVVLSGMDGEVFGVRYNLGSGSITFYTLPHLFTNYDLLYGDNRLLESIITQLPNTETYYSSNIIFKSNERADLLGFIHENRSLSWSFYLMLFSILIYLVFNFQRKLRPVPIIKSPENLNLSFLRTISDLHYDKKDYQFILTNKMIFLRDFIKHRYHLNSNKMDDQFMLQLSKRSGENMADIESLFTYYQELMDGSQINKYEFIKMNRLFQIFKINSDGRGK